MNKYLKYIRNTFYKLIQSIIYFIIAKCARYRYKVIRLNIKNSFPAMSGVDIQNLIENYYKNLAKYILEILSLLFSSKSNAIRKVLLKNLQYWQSHIDEQKSVILLASHLGNWEMNIVLFPTLIDRRVIGFYKPMSNKSMDTIMKKIRSRFGLELHPIENTARVMMQLKNEAVIYIFLGDQSPVNMNGVYWNLFLHQQTPWMTGAQKLAKKFNYPVLYLSQIPQLADSDYHYEMQISEVESISSKQNSDPNHIIQYYTELLSKEIEKFPSFWLWSHRRWKRAHLYTESKEYKE